MLVYDCKKRRRDELSIRFLIQHQNLCRNLREIDIVLVYMFQPCLNINTADSVSKSKFIHFPMIKKKKKMLIKCIGFNYYSFGILNLLFLRKKLNPIVLSSPLQTSSHTKVPLGSSVSSNQLR